MLYLSGTLYPRMTFRAVVFILVFLTVTQPLLAWNNLGHMTIAKITYDQLTVQERERFAEILSHHPHYQEFLLADRPESVSPGEWAFLRASTWSDWIRPPRETTIDVTEHPRYKFHRGPWHYINFPYLPAEVSSTLPPELPAETHILKQISASREILQAAVPIDPGAVLGISAEANLAIRFCWLSHLVGDLHQPLHAIALINEQRFPAPHFDDQGGNRIVIRATETAQPNRLHAYWDQLLGFDSSYANIARLARELTERPQFQPGSITELGQHAKPLEWAEESYRLAISHAYLNGQLPITLSDDFYSRSISARDVPVLPPGADTAAKQVAERRIVLAGYRYARMLR